MEHRRLSFDWTAAALSMTAAAALTLPTLGRQPLSWDEAVTASSAQRSLPNLARMLSHTDAPLGLYYLLMHGWTLLGASIDINPDNGWWLRLPSALAAVAAVGLLTGLVCRFLGVRAGLVAGLLFAVHPMLTYYAQDARPYTLVTLMFLISTVALMRALEHPRPTSISLYALAVVLTLYLHLFAVYALPAHVFLLWRRGGRRRPWAVAGAGIVVAVAPLAWVAHGQSAELGWIPRPSVGGVWSVLAHLGGGTAFVIVVGGLIGFLLTVRPVRLTESLRFLLIWVLVPPIALVLVDFVSPELVARYALVAVPAEATLLAIAAVRAHSRAVFALVGLAGVLALAASLVQLSKPFKYEDYRAAADVIGDASGPGDAVLFLPISSREGFDVYAHLEPDLRRVSDTTVLNQPASTDQIGGINQAAARIAAGLNGARTIFVLGDTVALADQRLHDPVSRAEEAVLANYRIVDTKRWGDLTLTVLRRDPLVN